MLQHEIHSIRSVAEHSEAYNEFEFSLVNDIEIIRFHVPDTIFDNHRATLVFLITDVYGKSFHTDVSRSDRFSGETSRPR